MEAKKIIFCSMIGIAFLAAGVSHSYAQNMQDTIGAVPAVNIVNDQLDIVNESEPEQVEQKPEGMAADKPIQDGEQSDEPIIQKEQMGQSGQQPEQEPKEDSDSKGSVVNPYVAYGYDQMAKDALQLEILYPDIIKLDSIGQSVEGRNLLLIKLGKGSREILLCGSHHAREYISSAYLMKMVETYSSYYKDVKDFGEYHVKDLLDEVTLYIVPMVNPDGVNLVQNGIDAVKDAEKVAAMTMLQPHYSQWKANINGVDLNRQYPAEWEVKKSNTHVPSSEMFKGYSPASEPEVQAMMALSRQHEFLLAASFHSKGEVIYWADSGTYKEIPSAEKIADSISKLTEYKKMPVSQDPAIYGAGYENWFRLEFKRPVFCIELTPFNNTDIPHADEKFDSLVWNKGKYMGLLLMQEAIDLQN